MRLVNITEQKAWLDKMIAGIEIAIGLQRGTKAAGRGMDAQQMAAEIGFQRDVKQLDVDLAYVVAHPFLEDIDQKAAVLLAADRYAP